MELLDKLLNRKQAKGGLVGISCNDHELSIAHVDYVSGAPELQLCDNFKIASPNEAGKLLARKVQEYGLEKTRCNYVMHSDDYNLLLIEKPPVEPAELAAAAKWKIKDMVDRPLEDLAISVFQVPAEAYRSNRDMVYVVAANRKKVEQAIAMVLGSGLTLESIDIPELAMLNLEGLLGDDSNGLAMMDLRYSGSMLNLCRNKSIYLTRHLNTQIGENINDTYEWDSVRERLALEIQRSLDYYESQMGQTHITRLLLTPRKDDSEELKKQLNDAMGIQVEVMNLEQSLGSRVSLPLDLQQSCMLAIGGALRVEEAA